MESKVSKVLDQSQNIDMKECKNLDEFSKNKSVLQRGATPLDINEKCLKLCQDYLGGAWLKQTLHTIQVKRLSGGLTNQTYYCALPENYPCDGVVPNEVAIRLNGPRHFDLGEAGNDRTSETIIALMVSENKLGPKIYGLFEEGQIQQFYKHRHFRYDEQNNPKLAEELFRILARLHAMDVPIKKNTLWFEHYETFYEKAFQLFPINKMINDWNLQTLKTHDLKKEIDWLKQTINKVKPVITFTHIDFRGVNIMTTEADDQIILCDFDHSSNTYRGFDFGAIFLEWGLNEGELFNNPNQLDKFTDDIKIKSLLKPYIEESVRILGKKYSENKNNSLDQLVREVKLFSLVVDITLILFCMKCSDDEDTGFPVDKKIMMKMAEINYLGYWQLKSKFIQDKIFD